MVMVVITAIMVSSIIYLYIGFALGKKNSTLGDLLPVVLGRNAKIESAAEFSSSATATSISLATVILAYFQLAGYFGLWLVWSVMTTVIGMYVVQLLSGKIWKKLSTYDHRPSLHEYLGKEYNSELVSLVASICTSLGFLLILATELVVGSSFLVSLIPSIPSTMAVIYLSSIGLVYTFLGGFRAVIKTDQLQMKFIWALIITLLGFYIYYMFGSGGISVVWPRIPKGIYDFTSRPGLLYFLIGLTIMNIPGYVSNMSIWQRIGSISQIDVINQGIRKSVWSMGASWSALVIIACFAFAIVPNSDGINLLSDLLISVSDSLLGKIVLFFVILGLYGAMLSTASTNLIVIGHTISEDIISKIRNRNLKSRLNSKWEYNLSRFILVIATIFAVFIVEGLNYVGFSIADLVFAIYGSALCLFPLIIYSLFFNKNKLIMLANFANFSAIFGFLSGWGAAFYGKIINNGDLVFMSPVFSLVVSGLIISAGAIYTNLRNSNSE